MREDIQCLRGIAISLVLLYHMFPSLFVNGFLGVDVFFVISGYLMARNLTSNKINSISDIWNFYYRRFKRILPLYYLIIFVAVVLVQWYLGESWWESNHRYGMAAVFIATNELRIRDAQDYFKEFLVESNSKNAFLHLWSLAVEMQFYMLVPFIFLALQKLQTQLHRLIAVVTLTMISLIAFNVSVPIFAFYYMLMRLWQFSAGFIALYWTETWRTDEVDHQEYILLGPDLEKSEVLKVPDKPLDDLVTGALIVLATCLYPYEIEVTFMRPLVTFTTAFIIIRNSSSQILQSRFLSYLGDISYVVYLVHWPVFNLFLGTTVRSHVFCTVTTFVTSILLHHFYEKLYLKLSSKSIFLLIFALFSANLILQYSIRYHDIWKHTLSADLQKIVNDNSRFHTHLWYAPEVQNTSVRSMLLERKEDYPEISVVGEGTKTKGNGSINVMVVGNSYVMNLMKSLHASFNENYSDWRWLSIVENYGFYADTTQASKIGLDFSRRHVEFYKPDVLIFIGRYSHSEIYTTPTTENDEFIQQMNENIAFYERIVKRIYILGSHPKHPSNFLNIFLQYATQNPDELESLHLNKAEADKENRFVKQRFDAVKCNKCKFFDLSHQFVEGDKYLSFDREKMLSYMDNSIHITTAGVKLCEPVFKELAEEILQSF